MVAARKKGDLTGAVRGIEAKERILTAPSFSKDEEIVSNRIGFDDGAKLDSTVVTQYNMRPTIENSTVQIEKISMKPLSSFLI